MKRFIRIIVPILLFYLILLSRSQWDSYRFYRLGMLNEGHDQIACIRYYGDSINSHPFNTYHSDKSRRKLEDMLNSSSDERLQLMIIDILRN